MKKLLLEILLFSSVNLISQNLQWAKKIGCGTPLSVKVDASGNVYSTGYYSATTDFDPGSGTYTLSCSGGVDIYISKLSSMGSFLWAKSLGGSTGIDMPYSLSLDNHGNVYTIGTFNSSPADFDPGINTYLMSAPGFSVHVFVSKLDENGNFKWAKMFPGTNHQEGTGIANDSFGNTYITGNYRGIIDFDPGPSVRSYTSLGFYDSFICKLDSNGNLNWVKTFEGNGITNLAHSNSIEVDKNKNVYTTGNLYGQTDFDPSLSNYYLTSNGESDCFVSALDSLGNFKWVKSFGGKLYEHSEEIKIDNYGNIYTTGYFNDTVDFDPGPQINKIISGGQRDMFIHKLSSGGDYRWAKQFAGVSNEEWCSSLTILNDNIYSTGYFKETVDFNPGPQAALYNGNSIQTMFINKLDSSGIFLNTNTINTSFGYSITSDDIGNIYLTGIFGGATDFDFSNGTNILNNNGTSSDGCIFVTKYSESSPTNLNEYSDSKNLFVYPNPSSGIFTISNLDNQSADIELYNVIGDKIKTITDFHFDLSDQSNGIYFLKILTKNGLDLKKIILNK